jgi:hypothetical protein
MGMRAKPVLGCGILALSILLSSGKAGGGESKLGEIIAEALATLDRITVSLATVKDEPTAKAAVPDLRKAAARWNEIRDRAEKEKPPSRDEQDRLKKRYTEKLQAADKKLKAEIARVKQLPGAEVALKEISLVVKKRK